MEVEINGVRSELISVNLRSKEVCVLYNYIRAIWLPCKWVNLVKKEGGES